MNQEKNISFSLDNDDSYNRENHENEILREKIEQIDISLIDGFECHPFRILENDDMNLLRESIKNNGILEPVILRRKNNRYEMISGHRRKNICKDLGIKKIPSIVKELSNEEAIIYMVDSNFHREKILPSEKARAYKMKLDAIKSMVKQSSRPLVGNITSAELLGTQVGESGRQVQRYIRLNYLIDRLLDLVDNNAMGIRPGIAIRPAIEISYLTSDEQKLLLDYINCNLITPSLEQAIILKKISQKNGLTKEIIENILDELKSNQIQKIKISETKLFSVLPKNIKREQIENYVLKACDHYSKYLKKREINR